MDTLHLLTTGPYLPFTVSFGVLIGIGVLEAIGLGFSAIDLDLDFDGHPDADAPDFLGWLGFGHVPLLAILISFTALFGSVGIALQSSSEALLGGPIVAWAAALVALVPSLALTGYVSHLLARFLPGEESTVISTDDLIGKRATIILGTALPGHPTKAHIRDIHGQSHYILVEPDYDKAEEGEELILVRREGQVFTGTSPTLSTF